MGLVIAILNTLCERYEHEIDYRLWDIGSSSHYSKYIYKYIFIRGLDNPQYIYNIYIYKYTVLYNSD